MSCSPWLDPKRIPVEVVICICLRILEVKLERTAYLIPAGQGTSLSVELLIGHERSAYPRHRQ